MQEVFPVFYINHHFLPGLPTGETFWEMPMGCVAVN